MPRCSIQARLWRISFQRNKWTCKKLFSDNNIWIYFLHAITLQSSHPGNQPGQHTERKLYQLFEALCFNIKRKLQVIRELRKDSSMRNRGQNWKNRQKKKQKTKNNGTQKTPADNANSRIVTHHQTKRKFTQLIFQWN